MRYAAAPAQVILIVPEEYGLRFRSALPAPVLLFADSADSQTRKSADRARLLLAGYGSGLAQLRLQIRGVSPLLAMPVAVMTSTSQRRPGVPW